MTRHSASPKTQVRPNHRPHTTTAHDITVIAASYHVLNRLALIQPIAPVSLRGGAMTDAVVMSPFSAIIYAPVIRTYRLYRLPASEYARLIAR